MNELKKKKKGKIISVCCEVWYDMTIEVDDSITDDELKEQLDEYCVYNSCYTKTYKLLILN